MRSQPHTVLLRAMLSFASVLVTGCSLFESNADVRLSASAPATARLGDSVAVRVTLENLSDVPVTFQGNTCPRVFRALSESGEEAGPPFRTILCPASSLLVRLAPGARHEYVSYWQAHTHGPRLESIVVQPGRYRIEPRLRVADKANGRQVRVLYLRSSITVEQ